jgi:hypothetical protein
MFRTRPNITRFAPTGTRSAATFLAEDAPARRDCRLLPVRRSYHHVDCAGQHIDAAAIDRQYLAIHHGVYWSVERELYASHAASRCLWMRNVRAIE